MNYRTTTFLLAVLLALALLYIVIRKPGSDIVPGQVQQKTVIDESGMNADLLKAWAADTIDVNTGAFITRDSARSHFARFHNNGVPKGLPYAFAFGINKLNQLMDNIRSENDRLGPDHPDRIVAVRVYLVKRFTQVASGPKGHTDVMLVPVKANKENYIDIGDPNAKDDVPRDDPDPLLLDTSSPCPDMCD